jgi:hypothetical protein
VQKVALPWRAERVDSLGGRSPGICGSWRTSRRRRENKREVLTFGGQGVVDGRLLGHLVQHDDLGEVLVEAKHDEGDFLLQLECIKGGRALAIGFNT